MLIHSVAHTRSFLHGFFLKLSHQICVIFQFFFFFFFWIELKLGATHQTHQHFTSDSAMLQRERVCVFYSFV